MSAVELFRAAARRRPGHVALVGDRRARACTYGDLERRALAAADRLDRAGLGRGDRVVVLVPMSIDLYAWVIALFLVDATVVFVEPWMPLDLLADVLDHVRPRGLLASPLGVGLASRSAGLRAVPDRFAVRGAGPLRLLGWRSLPGARAAPLDRIPAAVAADDAVLTFTTGSSGRPKGVVRSHGLLASQHAALSGALGLSADDVCLHVFANFILNNLALGATSVVPRIRASAPTRFDPAELVGQIAAARVTSIVCPPASLERIVGHCEARGRALPSVRRLATGGGPVPTSLLGRAAAVFPSADPEVVYGSTEAEPVCHAAWSELGGLRGEGACVGRPVAGARIRLGPDGEVEVAGDHVSDRYAGDPAARAACKRIDPDGAIWHRMGDLGRLDDAGRLWLTGRVDSVVHAAAGPVLPVPIERAAEAHPGVAAAAVIGMGAPGRARVVLAVEPTSWRPAAQPALRDALVRGRPEVAEVRFLRRLPRDRRHRSKLDYARLREVLSR